ncbi:MAG: hypothetical protein AAB929_03945 [Patescibacteria group bacterium]
MKPLKSKNLDKHLLNTISYFSFFGYPPSFDEIHTFFPEKIAKSKLKILLASWIKQKRLIRSSMSFRRNEVTEKSSPAFGGTHIYKRSARFLSSESELRNDKIDRQNNLNRDPLTFNFQPSTSSLYTLPQYAPHFKNRATRQVVCQKKLIPVKCYTGILAKIPFVRFIGITGSASMGNTTPHDDVDIFIITRKNCLFIGRFFAILIAHILHVRKGKNSVCLNLFFDEGDLVIPLQKQTPYVAHEVLQMKPVVNKNRVYERFIRANQWVKQFYPNVKLVIRSHSRAGGNPDYNFLFFPFELALKTLQLAIIRRNKTGLIISPTQLWLFKRDFEKKMERKMNGQTYL